jgi:hypothetical protein
VDYTITLSAKSYNSKYSFGILKSVAGSGLENKAGVELAITAEDWGAEWMKSVIPTKTETFDLILTATPHDTNIKPFMKHLMFSVKFPKLAIDCGKTDRKFQKFQEINCKVQFRNPLPYAISGAVMHFTVSGQWNNGDTRAAAAGQQLVIQPSKEAQANYDSDIEQVDPAETQVFNAKFRLNGAIGSQTVVAKLSSKDLGSVAGTATIKIGDAPVQPFTANNHPRAF